MLDPRPWIRFQCVPMVLFGVFFYFWPDHVLPYVMDVLLDGVHTHMARCTASFCITLPFMYWMWTNSTDINCCTPALKGLILFNGYSLAASMYARVYAAEFVSQKVVISLMAYFGLMMLANVYVLLRSGWHMGHLMYEPERQFTQNRLFMFDSYAALLIGFLWMGYPDMLLRRQIRFPLTQHHAYVCRVFGAILASSTVYGHAAVFFKNPRDRILGLTTRFFAILLVFLSQLHSQYASHQWWTHGHWVGMSLWFLWMNIVVLCLVNVFRGKWA